MEHQAVRSLGGRLALWLFMIFCIYFVWSLLNTLWALMQSGARVENWAAALSVVFALVLVGTILGAIAWYTRPVDPDA